MRATIVWLAHVVTGRHRNERVLFWTRQAASTVAFVLIVVSLLSIWFDDPQRLATGIGIFGAGLAFALQRVVTALAGYVVIMRGNTFTVGDRITMGGVRGDVIALDTTNSLAISQSRLVACIGLKDTVIVETPDAVLAADKRHIEKVREIVERLKAERRSEAAAHRKVYRPWGYYDRIDAGSRFQVKRIVVNPGAALSMQMHHHRAEHWVVVRGTARVTRGDKTYLVSENESTFIPLGTRHRLENPGKVPLEMIEVQSGAYLDEDDIVRFDDSYGRT